MVPRSTLAISASIQTGLAAAEAAFDPSDVTAALLILGDQPLLSVETIRSVTAGDAPGALVRPRYAESPDTPGHPALIGRTHWALARELTADRGFEPLLRARGLDWTYLDVAGANPDVDTPEDLAGLPSDRIDRT